MLKDASSSDRAAMPTKRIENNTAASLAALAANPAKARKLHKIRDEAYQALFDAVDQAVAVMTQNTAIKGVEAGSSTLSGAAFARVGRRISNDTKERRAYAMAHMVGALLNRNNPHWDPADPATDAADYDDPVVALMLMKNLR